MSTCYYPNGDTAQGGDQPCGSGDAVMCCPQDWTCQDNGLCYLGNQHYLGRYTCTDQSWKSSECPQICTSDTGAGGDEAVLDCGDGYCCDHNRPDAAGDSSLGCCETTTSRFQIENRQMVLGSGPGSGGSASSAQVSSSIQSPTAAPSSTKVSFSTTGSVSTASASASAVSFPLTVSAATYAVSPSASQSTLASITTGASSSTSSVSSDSSSGNSRTSVVLVTSVVTKAGGSSSTSVASHTNVIAEAASTSTSSPSPSKSTNLGAIIGPAVAVPIALIALAVLAFFFWRRRKQRRNVYNSREHANYEPRDPVDMYAAQKPHVPELDSPEMEQKKSPNTTSPPSYRGGPTDNSGEAQGLRLSSKSSELPGSPAFPPDGGPQPTQPSELEGNTYLPYRRPRT